MTPNEQIEGLIFGTLLPVARLAAGKDFPLRRLKQLVELATYGELKRRGLSMRDITERLSVSMAKVGQLSRQLKDHLSKPDSDYGVPRRLLLVLRGGAASEAQLISALSDCEAELVRRGIGQLREDGLIELVAGRTVRYRICSRAYRQVRRPWMARLDALNNLMSSVADTIRARFFEDDDRAFARTVSFSVREADLPKLRALYEETVFPLIEALDSAAEDEGGLGVSLSLLWAPDEPGGGA